MGTFFASRRNQVIVAVAAVVLLVLLLLAAFNLGRGATTKIGVSQAGSTVTLPSPSASASADTSPSPSAPSPAPSAAPPSSAPSPAVSPAASAAVPGTTSPALTTDGHELNPAQAAPSSDASPRGSSGAGCGIWVDSGWTLTNCGILAIRNSDQNGSVAFVVEEKAAAGGTARRVFLMTATDPSSGDWHVKLSVTDPSGTRYDKIEVKKGTIAGAPFPQVIVGFRINGTGHFLEYDIVEMAASGALTVAGSRNLDHGSANIEASDLVDYSPYPNASTPDYFIRTVIGYSGGAYRITDSSHAPERGPGDLAPPP